MDTQIIEAQFERLKDEQYQQALAEQAESAKFSDQNGTQKTLETVNDFVNDYLENGRHQPIDHWLIGRFNLYPEIWESEEEKTETANIIISTVESLVNNQLEIDQALEKGKTLANVLNKRIGDLAKQHEFDPLDALQAVNNGLENANLAASEAYLGQAIPLSTPTEVQTQLDFAREISTKAKLNANLHLMNYGIRTIGERLSNAVLGKQNRSQSEELLHILRSSIETAENKGVQVAMSGGVVVSAKKGWIKAGFDQLNNIENAITKARESAEKITNLVLNVAEGWNDTRLLDKVEQGVLTTIDVAAHKAKFATAKIITKVEKTCENWLKTKGTIIGVTLGRTIGALFSPAGAALGGVIGGYLGEKATGWVADKVVKPLAKVAKKVANKAIDVIKDAAKSVISKGGKLVKKVGKKIASFLGF